MALLVGIVGIYGVINYAVAQRRREMGIRLALGARQTELRLMFLRHGLVLAAPGVVIGLGVLLWHSCASSDHCCSGSCPTDPVTYLAVPVLLVAAALLASYFPARTASSVRCDRTVQRTSRQPGGGNQPDNFHRASTATRTAIGAHDSSRRRMGNRSRGKAFRELARQALCLLVPR